MNMAKIPLLRFAPSPTGSLHLGGLRTALFNELFARKNKGKWVLRIEDTDRERMVPGSVDDIQKSLHWAGLHYDYGPGADSAKGPYFQSERLDLYQHYADKLLKDGFAYRCFCSRTHLDIVRERLAKSGSNATYDKSCLHMTEEESTRRKKAGEKFVLRLNDEAMPSRIKPKDLVFGDLRDAHHSLPTDPILVKSDGFPTYHLASVVDDHHMGITHVLRGEEWLPSLPLHLDLYACLNLPTPQFAHLPLLLNPDGSKLSKRKGSVSVKEFIEQGWMPTAVLNWLALAGWGTGALSSSASDDKSDPQHKRSAPNSTQMLSLPELIDEFDLSNFTPRRAILDPKKLININMHHLQHAIGTRTGLSELQEQARKQLENRHPERHDQIASLNMAEVLTIAKDRIKNINELPALLEFLLEDDATLRKYEAENFGQWDANKVKNYEEALLKFSTAVADVGSSNSKAEWSLDTAQLIVDLRTQPDEMLFLRKALTGRKAGLPVAAVMYLLGREKTLERLRSAHSSSI